MRRHRLCEAVSGGGEEFSLTFRGRFEEGVQQTSLPFGGAPRTRRAPRGVEVGRFSLSLEFLGRSEVFEEFGNAWCSHSVLENGAHADGSLDGTCPGEDDIAGTNIPRRFHRLVVEPDVSASAGVGGQGSGFVETHGPEPFVDANGLGRR